jgi:hypothetical protein
MILRGYLRIEYFDRLPLLRYTPRGLEIEIETIADECLATMRELAATRDASLVPILELWSTVAFKKVRAAIRRSIGVLRPRRSRCSTTWRNARRACFPRSVG